MKRVGLTASCPACRVAAPRLLLVVIQMLQLSRQRSARRRRLALGFGSGLQLLQLLHLSLAGLDAGEPDERAQADGRQSRRLAARGLALFLAHFLRDAVLEDRIGFLGAEVVVAASGGPGAL